MHTTTHWVAKLSYIIWYIQESQMLIISFELNLFIVEPKLLALLFKAKYFYNFEIQKFSDLPCRWVSN